MANPEYFAKFGQFIHWYANVERIVHYVFRHFSGLPQEAARTIDGGMNLSALVSLIRRIIVARKVSQTDRNELECLFDHLGHITVLRDTLIHRGGESIGENVISTNYHVARSETDFEYIELNLKDIQDAMLDCTQMYMRFEQLMEPNAPWFKSAPDEARAWLNQPWRYKPRQPKKPNPKSPASAQSRQRQPRASRG
jgi:hypothetical protein